MVKRGCFAILGLLATSGSIGCFDVSETNLLVIDNFNDGDLQPLDPGFGTWSCRAVNPPATVTCAADLNDTEDGSAYSVRLDVAITDMLDGFQQHGGGALETHAIQGPVDFTRYERIGFDVKLQSAADNPLPINAVLYLELGCSTVLPESGEDHDLYVSQGVPYATTWHNVALTFVNFGPPPWLTEPIMGGTTACLRRVDRVTFSIDAQLADGASGGGVLHVDNVVLE